MELPESGERYYHRPELEGIKPSQLFIVAQKREQWIRDRVNAYQQPDALDHFINELENYITKTFPDGLPEIDVVSRDVQQTLGFTKRGEGTYDIEIGPRPFEGDAELYDEHTIERGTLYGFHRGEHQDLRAYVDVGIAPRTLQGGIYHEYLSVSVKDSLIQLTKYHVNEQLEERSDYIKSQLDEYGPEVMFLYSQAIRELYSQQETTKKLQRSSHIIAEIDRHQKTSQQFVDALLEFIALKLGLYIPHTIHVSSHRVVITDRPAAYKQHGPDVFENITPQLGLMGESANRTLGLFFFVKSEHAHEENKINKDKTVQVPVQSIENMYKFQP